MGTTRWVGLHTACQNFKRLYRGLDFVTYTIQMASTMPYPLQSVSLEQLLEWEWWAECMFQGWGRGKEPLTAWVQFFGQSKPFDDLLQHLPTNTKIKIKDLRGNFWGPVYPWSDRTPKMSVWFALSDFSLCLTSRPWTDGQLASSSSLFMTIASSWIFYPLSLSLSLSHTHTHTHTHTHINRYFRTW